ncbi:MAG: hypothetical protein PHI06_04030 [Desulfobulbaceae bacterium]|nr:hypothetical protein [Desulfobulbaceae bacterium]
MTLMIGGWLLSAAMLLLTLPCSAKAWETTPPSRYFKHYHPARLNQAALDAINNDDKMTALILLERAVRLAPHDQALQHNLTELRADMQQEPLQGLRATTPPIVQPPQTPPATTPPALPSVPSPPPLWEKKTD